MLDLDLIPWTSPCPSLTQSSRLIRSLRPVRIGFNNPFCRAEVPWCSIPRETKERRAHGALTVRMRVRTRRNGLVQSRISRRCRPPHGISELVEWRVCSGRQNLWVLGSTARLGRLVDSVTRDVCPLHRRMEAMGRPPTGANTRDASLVLALETREAKSVQRLTYGARVSASQTCKRDELEPDGTDTSARAPTDICAHKTRKITVRIG